MFEKTAFNQSVGDVSPFPSSEQEVRTDPPGGRRRLPVPRGHSLRAARFCGVVRSSRSGRRKPAGLHPAGLQEEALRPRVTRLNFSSVAVALPVV